MKWLWRIAGGLLAVGLAGYFLWFCQQNLDLSLLVDVLSQPRMALALTGATVCYMSIYPLAGWAWHHLLRRQGENHRTGKLILWLGITQLAKYIPGNIAQHAGRTFMALRNGMKPRTLLTTCLQEMLLALAASIVIGALALTLSTAHVQEPSLRLALQLMIVGSIAVCVLFCIELPEKAINGLPAVVQHGLRLIGGLPGYRTTLRCLSAYACNYLLVGLGIWLIALALGLGQQINYPLATAAFALSWALGFLAPGAPAGLGAREGIMLLVLQGHADAESILLLTLLSRAVSMAGDFLTFLLANSINSMMKTPQDCDEDQS